MTQPNENPKGLLYAIIGLVVLGLVGTFLYLRNAADHSGDVAVAPSPIVSASPLAEIPSPTISATPNADVGSPAALDLATDDRGLSKATVTVTTTKGVVKYKFYAKDAPNTTNRMIQLIQSGFYNGLTFHRVEPGFVVQGGDPEGTGTGGSGQKLKAEFNAHKHIEGTVAMARAMDPDSADSQFYFTLGAFPHLDNSYTVFGQVVEGIDVVRKLEVGDKMTTVTVQ